MTTRLPAGWWESACGFRTKDPIRVATGRIGGLALAASHDPREYTSKARQKFLARFRPDDPSLSPQEAERRAVAALKMHMAQLALASAKSRRARKNRGLP